MTPQQIVGLAVRLFALWLVLIAFQIVALGSAMREQLEGTGSLVIYVMPVVVLLIALCLWLFPMFVAHKLVPKTHDTDTLKIPARHAAAAGAAILGLWAVIVTLPTIIATVSVALTGSHSALYGMYFAPERVVSLLSTAGQFTLGLFLVVKPWFIANKIFRDSQ
jgi:hypothetical protein